MKVHLKDSAEPLKEGSDLIALCGKPVPKAVFAMIWNENQLAEFDCLPRACCCRCIDAMIVPLRTLPVYWYGIVPGEETVQHEA